MTSANRSSEPIAYEDDDAIAALTGIADAFLIGERPIARRVDDSVARAGGFGPVILRRSRGYAPGAVATIPSRAADSGAGRRLEEHDHAGGGRPGVRQPAHRRPGSLRMRFARFRKRSTICSRCTKSIANDLLVVHDAHPQYVSTRYALGASALPNARRAASSRAHRFGAGRARRLGQARDRRELRRHRLRRRRHNLGRRDFCRQRARGFRARRAPASRGLPGGDAAARYPVQAAAGFLAQMRRLAGLHRRAVLISRALSRCAATDAQRRADFRDDLVGRLFDTAAALLGFTREITFEGQAAMWLEHWLASAASPTPIRFRCRRRTGFPSAAAAHHSRPVRGRDPAEIARAFQRGIATGLARRHHRFVRVRTSLDTVVLSGGVFQNELLLSDLKVLLERERPADLDQSCRAAERWRHQPGTGGAGGVRPCAPRIMADAATQHSVDADVRAENA